MIVFIHFLAQRVCRTTINTLDAWQNLNGGVLTCCFLQSTGQKTKQNKNHSMDHSIQGLDASTSWKKADPKCQATYPFEKRAPGPSAHSPRETEWDVKLCTEREEITYICLHKCWALSGLTCVFARKEKAREGNQSAEKGSRQNLHWRW